MQNILILSYFYPPANFVGGQRTAAWAKYLYEFGYYPIIITRQWNECQTDLIDEQRNNDLIVEYNKTHEVHRLPYRRSLRDRLSNYPILKPLQKALTLKELLFSNYFLNSLPFSNFYNYSKRLLENDSSIKTVIASGRPFQAFSIGYQLKKDFPFIFWLPDYRDEWTTRKTNSPVNLLAKHLYDLDKESEQKWTSNSSFFITVSENWKKNISLFIERKGIVITNGYDGKLISNKRGESNRCSKLNLLYLGSVYSYQDFSIIFESIKIINSAYNSPPIHFTFLGSYANESELKELQGKVKELGDNVSLLPKVSHDSVQAYIQETDVLFLTEYKNLEGCLPVKIFDYYKSSKPILLCPSDNDLMESFIKETDSGFIANNQQTCIKVLESLIEKKKSEKPLIGARNIQNANFYSRKHQTKLLAEALDQLLNN